MKINLTKKVTDDGSYNLSSQSHQLFDDQNVYACNVQIVRAPDSMPFVHQQNYFVSFRARPVKFNDYLPAKPLSSFTGVNRTIGSIDPALSFSAVAKCFDPFLYGQERRIYDRGAFKPVQPAAVPTATHQRNQTINGSVESIVTGYRSLDRDVFKIPAVPTPTYLRNHTISGSIESISSGYHSDGLPIAGMSNVRKWLKSLRLHKYTWVFDSVSYEKMFSFTEDYLKSLNITQGASHKLAICIEKLKTRSEAFKEVEVNLSQNKMFVPDAIYAIEPMICSPMKPMRLNCDGDVGFQLWKVLNLGKFLFF